MNCPRPCALINMSGVTMERRGMKITTLLTATAMFIPSFGAQAADLAQQKPDRVAEGPSDLEIRDRDTNQALLQALLKRRAETAQIEQGTASNRAALEFLDERIAELTRRIGK